MSRTTFLRDDRGVSQVVGIVLLVAVAVILAGIIGAFVLDIGSDQETVPQAKFTMEGYDANGDGAVEAVNVTHDGGESFESGTLKVVAGSDEAKWDPGSEIAVGDTFVVDNGSTGNADKSVSNIDGETVKLVYVDEENDRGVVIMKEQF